MFECRSYLKYKFDIVAIKHSEAALKRWCWEIEIVDMGCAGFGFLTLVKDAAADGL